MLPPILTFIDVETTGLSVLRDRIIEVGIIRVEDGKIVDTLDSLVNPECSLPREIEILTGIYPEQLDNAPTFYDLRKRISEMFQDSIFVAHNARFDYSFIRTEFKRLDETFRAKILCTAKLSRRLFPRYRRHSLDSIIKRFDIQVTIRHRAMADAQVLWEFMQKVGPNGVNLEKAVIHVLKTPVLPPGISQNYIDNIPESCGVYIFYASDGSTLYIGKSTNIKDRVLSHFQNSLTNTKDARIFQRVASLEYKETNGELGALLLESKLIKQYQPMYNRMLRRAQSLIGLVQEQTPDGYLTFKTKELSEIPIEDISKVLAFYKTQRQLKNILNDIALSYKLCKKLLGLEKTKGVCFGSQIDLCNGACIGKELPAYYNLRFIDAFKKTKVRQWPFKESMVIAEGKQGIIVSNWCIIGSVDGADLQVSIDNEVTFDYDAYKILSSFLLRKQKSLKLYPISLFTKLN